LGKREYRRESIEIVDKYANDLDVRSLCQSLDVAPATYYRAKQGPKPKTPRRSHRRLGVLERKAVLDMLTSEEFIDMAVPEVFHTLLDRDEYLCSISTMYVILRENKAVKDRRDQRKHPEYKKPELVATGPNQVWSWDITKLKGPAKGELYNLYVVIDIFSRFVVGWTVSTKENGTIARDFIEKTCQLQGIARDQISLHADRGSPMKCLTVSEMMMDLGILKSFSRPRVSNDNPYSESQFKTLKYHRTFPGRFGSVQDARAFLKGFFEWYNGEHYHSGISMLTPATVHYGKEAPILEKRAATLTVAFEKHPERFVRGLPKPKQVPAEAWINQPTQKVEKVA